MQADQSDSEPKRPAGAIDYGLIAFSGHGRCYALAPEAFAEGSDGRGLIRNDLDVPAGVLERAAGLCPENAITVR
jgi:ferredoxin